MSISNGFPGKIKLASQTMSGLMSSSDYIKLNAINPEEIIKAKQDIETLKNIIMPTKIYTISIELLDKNPYDAVTYMNDAAGFEPLHVNQTTGECNYGSWKDIINSVIRPKPCLVKDSNVITYLDPNNYARSIYGSGVDITNESSGDIMIEFSKVYYKLEKKDNNTIYFSISTDKIDDTWICDAFISEDGLREERDYMYYSAYEGWIDSYNKLRSLSSKIPTADKSIVDYRTSARIHGSNYSLVSIAKRMYISLLTIMVTKSLDIKTTIGLGVSDLEYTGTNNAINTGTMNMKGLFYGNNTGKNGIKVFGIENFIGNLAEFTEGLVIHFDKMYSKIGYPYNDLGNGYTLVEQSLITSQWVKHVIISNNLLIPSHDTSSSGSSHTYFSSYTYMPTDFNLKYACAMGGSYYMNQSCGHLCMDFRYALDASSVACGSRIVCC